MISCNINTCGREGFSIPEPSLDMFPQLSHQHINIFQYNNPSTFKILHVVDLVLRSQPCSKTHIHQKQTNFLKGLIQGCKTLHYAQHNIKAIHGRAILAPDSKLSLLRMRYNRLSNGLKTF